MSEKINILHFVTDLDRRSGGLSVSVPSLCQELAALPDVRVCLATRPTTEPIEIPDLADFSLSWIDGGRKSVDRVFSEVRERYPEGDTIVHLQGLWDPIYHWATELAMRHRMPIVTSIRGMLEPWAMKHKRLKKSVAWHVYQRRNLLRATALHATSPTELESIKRVGLPTEAAFCIPNGVTPPPGLEEIVRETPREPVLLFLGRIHPIKGLGQLIDAWAAGGPSGWTLQITGPDCNGYRSELEKRIRRHRLEESVRITDLTDGEAKWRTLAGASALVLPSFSENFGLVVVEALATGIPVAATTGSPWQSLETAGAGWWVNPDVSSLTEFLRQLGGTTAEERLAMGKRGQELVSRHYTWGGVASRFADVYRELATGKINGALRREKSNNFPTENLS